MCVGGGGLASCQKGFTEATSICDHAEAQGGERKLDLLFSGFAVWKSGALCCEFQKNTHGCVTDRQESRPSSLLTSHRGCQYNFSAGISDAPLCDANVSLRE